MSKSIHNRPFIALVFGLILMIMSNVIAQPDSTVMHVPPSVIFELLALNHDLPTPKFPKYRSPADLVASPDKSTIYICEQTAKRIAVFSLVSESVTGYIHLPNEVTGCAVSSDGITLYATCSSDWWPAGDVCVIDVLSGNVTSQIAVGFGACSPVLSPDNATLFVCNRFSNDVSIVDLVSQKEITRIPVLREPYCAAITSDGSKLLVGNLLPDEVSTDTLTIAADVTLINTATAAVIKNIPLPCGSHSLMDVTVSPDGKYGFTTHLLSRFKLVASTVAEGWLHTNNMAVIDLSSDSLLADVCLDESRSGMANPWGVACSEDGSLLTVTHAGSNELSVIQLQPFLDSVIAGKKNGETFQRNFTVLSGIRTRIPVETKGPRSCVFIDSTVYTAGYFDDLQAMMESYRITPGDPPVKNQYSIGISTPQRGQRKGEQQLYNGTLCFQNWQSCVSCHPFGRTDGLNHIMNGGAVHYPKNTITLIHSWWTPPTGWYGRGHAESAIKAGIELELFQAPTDSLADPMDTCLMYMKPTASPHLEKGSLSEPAKHGKLLYYNKDKVDCIICHPPPLFCDKILRQTTIPDPFNPNTNWMTPPLREVWRTGPYGHIGSLKIRGIFETTGHSTNFSELTEEEKNDLLEYLLSL